MSGTRQPTGIALGTKLDSLIETHEQRVATLKNELVRAQREAAQYRELRALLDQVLEEVGTPSGVGGPDGSPGGARDAADAGGGVRAAGRPGPSTAAPGETRPSIGTSLPIDDVFEALKARSGQVLSPADVNGVFPGATRVQVNDRLGRLYRQGKITRVAKGRFQYSPPPAAPTPTHAPAVQRLPQTSASEDSPPEEVGTVLNTVLDRVVMVMAQRPERTWRPEDFMGLVSEPVSVVRSALQQLEHHGRATAVGENAYRFADGRVAPDGWARVS